MRRKWLFYMSGFLSGVTYITDRFIYSNIVLLYISTCISCILMAIYILTDKIINSKIKDYWKHWNTAQKIVLLVMIIINIYVLGEINLFSNFKYFLAYICINYIVYILFIKTDVEIMDE